METQKGLYLGTEINEKWRRRYVQSGFLARGNGQYWFDDKGFYFLRTLTREPIFISFDKIFGVKLGKWHSGRWAFGNLILKIIWELDGLKLSSGFIVSKNSEEIMELKKILEGKISRKNF